MWTKRNDHAPKSERVEFFITCPKRVVLKKKKKSLTILVSSLIVAFYSSQQNSLKNHFNGISMSWAPSFILLEHIFCLSHHKTRWTMLEDNVGLKICLLGTSNFMVTLTFFPWCKLKWSRMSSTTHHLFHKALGRLHGPWCKQTS
jgi:hypothetical protein